MRYSIILHLQRRSACCTTQAGVAVSFTSTSATPLISPQPHAQLAHVDADHAVRTFIHVSSSQPRAPGGQHHTPLPDVRGSRVFVGWDESNHPTTWRLSRVRPPSSTTSLYVYDPLDDHRWPLCARKNGGRGFGSIYHDTCSRYDQNTPRSRTLNRAELQSSQRSCRCGSSYTCSITDDPFYALSSYLSLTSSETSCWWRI